MQTPLKRCRRLLRRVWSDQLQELIINRRIFDQFCEATKSYVGSTHSSELAGWIYQCYVAFAVSAVRRLVEPPPTLMTAKQCPKCGHIQPPKTQKKNASVSLLILLEELKQSPTLLTRNRFRRLCKKGGPVAAEFADKWFDGLAKTKGVSAVPIQVIEKDIAALKRQTKRIKKHVNKRVAHAELDRRKIGKCSCAALNSAIELTIAVYQNYALLIDGKRTPEPPHDHQIRADFSKLWPPKG